MVSNLDDLTVIELNNPVETSANVNVKIYDLSGSLRHEQNVTLTTYQTYHLILNGVLNSGEVGYAVVDSGNSYLSSITSHYKKSSPEAINYGYATPFTKTAPEVVQMSEFNSFLQQANDLELANVSGNSTSVSIVILDYLGNVVQTLEYNNLLPNTSIRVPLTLPTDSYGTIIVDGEGIVVRNYVTKPLEYVLPYIGK